jgi:hypothetical protein
VRDSRPDEMLAPPIGPLTLDDGTHLGSLAFPLGASLPIDLRSQSCSSRCPSWELCYRPPSLPPTRGRGGAFLFCLL